MGKTCSPPFRLHDARGAAGLSLSLCVCVAAFCATQCTTFFDAIFFLFTTGWLKKEEEKPTLQMCACGGTPRHVSSLLLCQVPPSVVVSPSPSLRKGKRTALLSVVVVPFPFALSPDFFLAFSLSLHTTRSSFFLSVPVCFAFWCFSVSPSLPLCLPSQY